MFRSSSDINIGNLYLIKKDAEIRYFDENLELHKINALDEIPYAPCYFIDDSEMHYWIYSPKEYKSLDNHSLEYLPEKSCGIDVLQAGEDTFFMPIIDKVEDDNYVDYMVIASEEPLFNWDQEDQKVENFIKNYNLAGDGHWCYDGYYFITEDSYEPHGENIYYFCVDSYIIKSFLAGTRYSGCKLIVPALIDTMLQHQTEEGYIPTYSFSVWLDEEYKIKPGFYDTRFNTDFWQYVLDTYNEFGGDCFYDALKKYGDFYLNHANQRQIKTQNGYFVADYFNPKGGKLTHASLNHNIAEAELCMNLADFFGDSSYQIVANKILKAIEDTADQWIMDDNNLEYAICPDKSFAFEDYPYLTYNDLYDIQKMLQDRGLQRNASLEKLMNAKRKWMDRQGITEYKK